MRLSLLLVGIGAASLGAVAGAFAIHRIDGAKAIRFAIARRIGAIDEQARRAPEGAVLVVGDSIAERSGLTSLCGRAVFNGGVSSATAEDVADHARGWIASLHPSIVIVALGMNDAKADVPAAPDRFEGAVRAIAATGVPTGLAAITRLEDKPAAAGFSQARIDALNTRLAAIAAALHAPLAPSIAAPTEDGVHPTDAGRRQWRANLERACPAAPITASGPASVSRRNI
ncbi:SGNH/GDSL hydrolase family protein [Sphingomonas bacterium]|uniref:SGNH/GDSL hydrolase family protein n=1 Tax=Sphingomonas bacterium TaxID=1895847 RepID=UPI0015757F11|nr:SGNH/GDSL hydrolase family protein [Sphingomonas bacterium]